jgi:hypothetical protein
MCECALLVCHSALYACSFSSSLGVVRTKKGNVELMDLLGELTFTDESDDLNPDSGSELTDAPLLYSPPPSREPHQSHAMSDDAEIDDYTVAPLLSTANVDESRVKLWPNSGDEDDFVAANGNKYSEVDEHELRSAVTDLTITDYYNEADRMARTNIDEWMSQHISDDEDSPKQTVEIMPRKREERLSENSSYVIAHRNSFVDSDDKNVIMLNPLLTQLSVER